MNALMRSAATVTAIVGFLATPLLAADVKPATAAAPAATPATVADGKAEGTLTVNGKVSKVAYAYAHSVPGFFDKTKNDVQVIVSDVPPAVEASSEMAAAG